MFQQFNDGSNKLQLYRPMKRPIFILIIANKTTSLAVRIDIWPPIATDNLVPVSFALITWKRGFLIIHERENCAFNHSRYQSQTTFNPCLVSVWDYWTLTSLSKKPNFEKSLILESSQSIDCNTILERWLIPISDFACRKCFEAIESISTWQLERGRTHCTLSACCSRTYSCIVVTLLRKGAVRKKQPCTPTDKGILGS